MIDESLVVAAYRLLLGREPESSDAVKTHAQVRTVRRLLENFVNSGEFRGRFPGFTLTAAWVWAETQFGRRLRVNLGDRSVSAQIIEGSFEPEVTRAVQNLLRPGHVALDIGANLGYFTVLMGGIVGSGGHVHAFEGRADLAESTALSVAENGFDDRVTVHSVALSDRAGPAYMVYIPTSTNWGGAYLSYDARPPRSHVAAPVQSARLVDLVPSDRVDLIKIDVEGAEPLVLSSFKDRLRRFRPVILSEIHAPLIRRVSGVEPEDYVREICGLGYRCRLIGGRELPASFSDFVGDVIFEPA